jgi:hypothetical protein
MIKAVMKLRIEGMYLNIIKTVYDKPVANIIVNQEKLKTFLIKSGTRQWCPLFPLLFNSLGIPSQSSKTGRRNINRKGSSQTIPICKHNLIPK